MSQDSFEIELRTMLARRDPGPAPATLLRRIEAERETSPRRFRGLSSALPWLATGAAAIVVVLALALVIGQRVPLNGPGASPSPGVTAPILRAGDGVADGSFVPLAQAAFGVIVLGILVRTALAARSRAVVLAATLAAVGVVWVGANINRSDALGQNGGIGGVIPPSSRQDDQPGTFLGVKGNAPFHVLLTITNDSSLPLELRGFEPGPSDPDLPQLGPRFVALGVLPPQSALIEDAAPFRPTTLEPGGSVDLVLLGMAGVCALPAPPADRIGGGFTSITSVDFVYDQLTMIHRQPVELMDPVNVWWPDSCSSDNLPP